MKSFASDNAAGVHPAVMAALAAANDEHALAYGDDRWTRAAVDRFRELFGAPVEVLFVWGGTGANVVGLSACLRPWEAVICAHTAHINVDECGAPERLLGAKLIDLPTADGKLLPEQITGALAGRGSEHHVQPSVVSITQSTELGTLYRPDEVAALADVAHANGMRLHMDGARIANATVAVGGDLRSITLDAGVDVLSFGGTKNGMMYGEAVVFLAPELAGPAAFLRKQASQLPSKMRYVAAQFEALLSGGLWLANARNANETAQMLAAEAARIPGITVTQPPEVNAVFATVPEKSLAALQERSFFWVWDEATSEVRWMTSFDTTRDDIDRFVAGLREVLAGG